MDKLYAIVILHYNDKSDTERCLQSLNNFSQNDNFVVIVVNNDVSCDISYLLIRNYKFEIKLLNSLTNRGFAGGINDGIKIAMRYDVRSIVLLNNDTIIINNDIDRAVNMLLLNNKLGVLGLVNYYYDNPTQIWQAGANNNFDKFHIEQMQYFDTNSSQIKYVDYVPGSSFIFNIKLLKDIGFFDERYFAYWEENDFCNKAQNAGWSVGFIQNSIILHKTETNKRNSKYTYLYVRNKFLFFSNRINKFKMMELLIKEFFYQVLKAIKYGYIGNILVPLFYAYKDYFKENFYKGNLDKI